MSPSDRKLRIFLCHSSHDKPTVHELYERLDAEGWIDAWLDAEKLYPGQDWNYEIEQAVEASDVILVSLSKNSVSKEGYVQRELRIVLDLAEYKPEGTLFIIPIRLEECEPPRRLRTWQYADYFPKEDRDHAYARLLVSLRMRATMLGISVENSIEETPRREVERDKEMKEQASKDQQERVRKAEEKARQEREERHKREAEISARKEAEKESRQMAEDREKRKKEDQGQKQAERIVVDQFDYSLNESTQLKTTNNSLITVTVVTIMLIVCCVSMWAIWQYGDQILKSLGG